MIPTSSRQLIEQSNERIKAELFAMGWRRRNERNYTVELTQEVIGCFGMNRATGGKEPWVELNPIIGVRHQPLERLVAEITGTSYHQYSPITVGKPLCYLLPAKPYVPWIVTPGTDIPSTIGDMVRTLKEYGIPFLEKHKDIDAIIKTMETPGFKINMMHGYRIPLAYVLSRKPKEAAESLRMFLGLPDLTRNVSLERYAKFAAELKRRYGLELEALRS